MTGREWIRDYSRTWGRRVGHAGTAAWGRLVSRAWPIVQGTAAATVSWVTARHVVDHHQPFFAPIAAVVALNASRGERGTNALRLLFGVLVGIAVAEVALWVIGPGYVALALAVLVSMVIAQLFGGRPIVLAQAAAGAILTIATGSEEVGGQRIIDALIGVGVSLVFSQIVFAAEPITLLRRAETTALTTIAEALRLAADALERGDRESADQAVAWMRGSHEPLAELNAVQARSDRTAKLSPLWWRHAGAVRRERRNAERLDILDGSCRALIRTATAGSADQHPTLGPRVRELSTAVKELAGDLGDLAAHRRAAADALRAVRRIAGDGTDPDPWRSAARLAVRTVATDIMVFAGVDPADAGKAVRGASGEPRVATPPAPTLPVPRWRLPGT